MGITISSPQPTSPLSAVSISIGFISFAFTVATALRVFWDNLGTIYSAPRQIVDNLGNLKFGLYQERRYLKLIRKRQRRRNSKRRRGRSKSYGRGGRGGGGGPDGGYYWEEDLDGMDGEGNGGGRRPPGWTKEEWTGRVRDVDIFYKSEDALYRTQRNELRDMLRDFKSLEEPFLKDGERSRQRRQRAEEQRTARSSWEKEEEDVETYGNGMGNAGVIEEDEGVPSEGVYRACGLRERWVWLRKKAKVMDMLNALQRMQTRRIAKEVGEVYLAIRDVESRLAIMDEKMQNVEGRLSRVVGVRRVE